LRDIHNGGTIPGAIIFATPLYESCQTVHSMRLFDESAFPAALFPVMGL
jgi:hypothetical protein